MRIIGGHDYYDSGLAYGQDESLIFMRNGERKIPADEIEKVAGIDTVVCSGTLKAPDDDSKGYNTRYAFDPRHGFKKVIHNRHSYETKIAYVILCGTLYNGLYIERTNNGGFGTGREGRWFWKADALRAYAQEEGLELYEGVSSSAKAWKFDHSKRHQVEIKIQTIEEWMTPVKLAGRAREYLVDERITIASRNPTILVWTREDLNWDIDQDTLKSMEFAKAVDPYTAFQEISMWIGGVIPRNGPPMVEITDNRIKIEKHGFHHPTSFRRQKAG